MITQYPHKAQATVSQPFTKLPNGDKVASTNMVPDPFYCRAEASNGKGYVNVNTQDGKAVIFDWIVYCDTSTPELPVGTSLRVLDKDGLQICNSSVKRFLKGQLNCRIWL